MRYGIALPITGVSGDVHRLIESACVAEEAGWDGLFLEDYILYYTGGAAPVFDPWVTLAAIAMRTKHIRMGVTVTPLARRRPWKVARESVTLDHLSLGRLIVGVGLGDSGESSLVNFGEEASGKRRARMLDEALEIIVGLWSGREFSYRGEHYSVKPSTFLPTPVQQPRIPIWIGGGWPREATVRRAARWDGACLYKVFPDGGHAMLTPADVGELKSSVARLRTASSPFDIVVGGVTSGNKPEQARAHVQALANAGVTWWVEFGSADPVALRDRIRHGPPRFETTRA